MLIVEAVCTLIASLVASTLFGTLLVIMRISPQILSDEHHIITVLFHYLL